MYRKHNIKRIRKKRKRKLKLWVVILLIFIFSLVLIINALKIIKWVYDNRKSEEIINYINDNYDVEEVNDNENETFINEPNDNLSDYWYYVKFPMIQVDFDVLKEKNSDTVAWINVNNTNINYPVVQSNDNNYYLHHSFDKSVNEAGWVFMDYRNNSDFNNKNTIIYAHSRLDKTMFGSLSKVLNSKWYNEKENHIIKVSTPLENSLWQIFSVYKIKEETYYLTTNFKNEASYSDFLQIIKNRSIYNFNTDIDYNDNILTLSTCYSNSERTVVHAKLIKKSLRN